MRTPVSRKLRKAARFLREHQRPETASFLEAVADRQDTEVAGEGDQPVSESPGNNGGDRLVAIPADVLTRLLQREDTPADVRRVKEALRRQEGS